MRPNNIEDIYPLSPMQQGILFHTLYATEPETYLVQVAWTLRGALDAAALQRAFQEVFDRHPALRTAFAWEKLAEPMQIVWKRLKIVFDEHNLRALPPEERAERARRYAEDDRKKGFDPTRAPLMRFGLLRIGDEAWRFVWSMHHLLLDGWSTQIVVKEAFATYEGIVRGAPPRLPRARPYGEYIGWLKKQDRAAIEAFWKKELEGFSAPTSLGIERAGAIAVDPHAAPFGVSRRSFDEATSNAIVAFTRQHGLTANTLVQGAWAILLARYSREEDVVFGSTVSGRSAPVPGIDGMVGLFINTLAVRARPRADMGSLAFLTALQAHEAELRDREHSPLAEVQTQSDVPRGTPLFESLVVFENFPLAESAGKGTAGHGGSDPAALAVTDGASSERPPYPITLTAILQRALMLQIAYDARRFDASAIDRMLGHLVTIIEAIVAQPSLAMGRLPMLSVAEIAAFATWNETAVAHPSDTLLHDLVAAQVARTPDAIALVFEGARVTYAEMEARANRIANRLRALGVGPDSLVAVCLDRSIDLPIALYGVLKAGGAYVPIDPSYPKDRLDFMIESARAGVLLTDARLAPSLADVAAQVIAIDTDAEIASASASSPDRVASTSSLAYVIYTSGSTGKPKGVMIPHRAIVNHMAWMARAFPLDASRAVLHKTPVSFDASVWEIWLPLMCGARLVIARPGGHREPAYLIETMVEAQITDLQLVPSMLEILLLEPDLERCTSLDRMFLGGEALSRSLVERLRARRDVTVVNLYGPTECTVQSIVWTSEKASSAAMEPIGRPIDNVRAHVLDAQLSRVPVGVAGELYIAGAAVGRGYLGRPDWTAERFLRDPFSDDVSARMYKTGDLCRVRADGVIEYVGRADFQVKLRGFRIELGEIEAVLAREPAVREAVVLLREDTPGDQRLVAYVVARGEAPSAVDLAASLEQRLPDHMIPTAFVMLDAIPLSPNGKVDRRSLPAPGAASHVRGAAEHVAPRTQVEQAIVEIFAEVLKLAQDAIGVTDSFFDLGGHSLLATQAITRVRAALGVDAPLRALFEAPTPAALASRVAALLASGGQAGAPPIVRVPRSPRMPLSFGQERLWFLSQLDPESPAYVIPLALRLGGQLDLLALERVLTELVRRHEVLRTTFASDGGKPVQIIHDPAPVPLPRTSLAALSREDAERAVRAEAEAEARRPFDLATGPVIRARLLEIREDDHVLLLTLHHIVSDVWTSAILNREITALYEAFSARHDAPSPLPELAVQYADYAVWQRAWLSGAVLEEHLSYWKKQLEGAPSALELPADRPRPPVQSYRGAARTFAIGAALTAKLKDLARREGVTLYMTLLAAFDVLLHRWSGQDDIVVGTPIAGRQRAETEGLVGFFLNTQVIRAQIAPEASFKDLLARVKVACLGAYAHQDMPFERLVQEIQPEPDPSRSPVFQVIFNLQNVERAGLRMRGLKLRGAVAENATVKVDLTLIMGESADGLVGRLEYSTDLFDAATIDRFARQLEAVYAAATKEPLRKIADLVVVPEDERTRLLVEWNDTSAPLDTSRCFHELFEAQVDATPDAIALVAGDARLTYSALDERANRLARHLRGRGVGPDAAVGLCLPRSADIVIGILGIMKAGGAYVPLDPAYPPRRLAQILADAHAEVVVTNAALAEALRAGEAEIASARPRAFAAVRVDADAEAIDREIGARLEIDATPANLAYVLFTSGSTGTPKGVAIEHRNLVNYVLGVNERLALAGLGRGSTYAHVSTFSADLGNTVLFPPLATGGVVYVVPEALTTDPDGLSAYFEREGIDCLKIVPSHLFALLSGARSEHVIPRKLIVLGGEGLSWDLIGRIERIAPDCKILNHYGPTETTIGVLTNPIEKGYRVAGTAIAPLGRPLPNSRVYVLDAAMQPAPIGVPGEIYVGGGGVARGYLNRPDLTKDRFVRDPFAPSSQPGARLYRSGDRARVLPDGTIAFLGRVDFQVKIRGFRIELGEIEAALSTCPGLKEAVVLVEEDPSGDKRLVAYVVPSDPSPDLPGIRRLIEQRLPDYMIPSAFVVLGALPLNANGKIDRRALAALERQRDEGAYVAPRNPIEEVLAAIWCDVFDRERIGIHERFNDLGGHSLLAIQIVARARDAFNAEVPLRAIFEAPTIASLAERIAELQLQGDPIIAPPIVRAPRDQALPLSFAQERLWFLDRLEPGNAFYNVASGMRLFGALDEVAIERALAEVVRRHEVLRTTFALSGEDPVQIVHPELRLTLVKVDLADLPVDEREARLRVEAAEEARTPFDLEVGPLLRARLVRLAPEEHALLLTVHHIVSDAQTQHVLATETAALYEAFKSGDPSPLPELSIQYADYAAWQRAWLTGDVLERQLGHWRSALEGAPSALDLPLDRPRPPVMSYRGDRRTFTISATLRKALAELSRQRGVTLFMTMLAAFDVLLHRRSGQPDVVIGTPMTSRTHRETEGLIGFFLNMLAIRTNIDGSASFDELLQRVRDACLGAYAHQDLPFERLVHELSPKRDLSRTPIFQVLFTLQSGGNHDDGALRGLRRRSMPAAIETAKYDLSLFLVDGARGITGIFEFATDLFDATTIDRMGAELVTLLEGIVAAPEAKVADLPMLPETERARILDAWNATDVAYPHEATIADLFEAQVARTPDAIAASFEGRDVTYRALDAHANRLANHLRSLGVGPDVPVGIAMQRGLDLVTGVLAILKAGGAYVPLDPDYPASRLAFMLEDANARILLKQARFVGSLPRHDARVIKIDEFDLSAESTSPPDRAGLDPSHLAYIIFTSGSTGRPKGVEMPHRALVNLVAWQIRTAPSALKTIQLTSPSFDVFFQEVFTTWCAGGHLVLIPEDVRRDVLRLRAALADHRVERMFLPPVALYQLAEIEGAAPLPDSMREVIVAGEQIQITSRVAALLESTPGVVLKNHYGPSESHVVTEEVLTGPPSTWPALPAIGRPIQNARIYLLDARRLPVPIGVPGELYIGGLVLARGYLGRPESTQERFLDDPFRIGERVYRTGDLARYRVDGTIEFLGRVDHQVKIRGYRVELGEIESVLGRHPGVRDVVVVAREYGPMDKRLVAYLVPSEALPSVEDIKGFLKSRLPDYMVPPAFVVLTALPLTPTGKVDRKALPPPVEATASNVDGYAAPRDEVEVRLAAIWRDVLGVRRIGINDSFFDLGGHSILAVRMMREVERAFGKKIPLVALFESQTIERLAQIVHRGDEDNHEWPSLVPMRTTGNKRPLFLVARPNVNSLGYVALIKKLDPAQPVYGLQLQYPEESVLGRPYTLEERHGWAMKYIELMKAVQPEGPYLIAGMCEGALIAFDMVRTLEEAGDRVRFFGVFDTFPEENTSRFWLHRVFIYERTLKMLWNQGPDEFYRYMRSRAGRVMRTVISRVAPSVQIKGPALGTRIVARSPWDERMFPGPSFVPPQVDAHIDLFRVRKTYYWRIDDPEFGWGNRTRGGVDVHFIGGDHDTFMRSEHVPLLGKKLRDAIAAAEEQMEAEAALAARHGRRAPDEESHITP